MERLELGSLSAPLASANNQRQSLKQAKCRSCVTVRGRLPTLCLEQIRESLPSCSFSVIWNGGVTTVAVPIKWQEMHSSSSYKHQQWSSPSSSWFSGHLLPRAPFGWPHLPKPMAATCPNSACSASHPSEKSNLPGLIWEEGDSNFDYFLRQTLTGSHSPLNAK